MSGDIRLEESEVVVEATTLACHSTDLVIDHPDRRKSAGGTRRALVHDFDDGLTLNWAGDYPGGVAINGKVRLSTIAPSGVALKVETADLELDSAARRKNTTAHRRALVHDSDDGLTLNWAGDYPGGVTINGKVRLSTLAPSGLTLKVETADIELDRADRRKNTSAHRRALVHDFDDGLTLNWNGDYPGGVTIKGKLKTEEITATKLALGNVTIHPDSAPTSGTSAIPRTHKVKIYADTIRFETAFMTGKAKAPGTGGMETIPTTTTLDLVETITSLQHEVTSLRARVAALESKG